MTQKLDTAIQNILKITLIRRKKRIWANANTHNTLDSLCQIPYWIKPKAHSCNKS